MLFRPSLAPPCLMAVWATVGVQTKQQHTWSTVNCHPELSIKNSKKEEENADWEAFYIPINRSLTIYMKYFR